MCGAHGSVAEAQPLGLAAAMRARLLTVCGGSWWVWGLVAVQQGLGGQQACGQAMMIQWCALCCAVLCCGPVLCVSCVDRMADGSSSQTKLTGTPAFTAPELVSGNAADPFAADVWALGACLFCFIYGRVPFQGGCVLDVFKVSSTGSSQRCAESPCSATSSQGPLKVILRECDAPARGQGRKWVPLHLAVHWALQHLTPGGGVRCQQPIALTA